MSGSVFIDPQCKKFWFTCRNGLGYAKLEGNGRADVKLTQNSER